jgi:phenylalanyl-tRNA synthetase beta chain
MRVNLAWLQEYMSERHSPEAILRSLTLLGFEVEDSYRVSEKLEAIRVGFIREKRPHPQLAERFICQIDLGEQTMRQIVCATEHPIDMGWGVPVALPGTHLPTGIDITEDRYGGVESSGMICLDREMGFVARGSGLQVLPDQITPGTRLVDVVDIPDVIVEIDVLPNRPDCMNFIGLAREVCASLGGEVRTSTSSGTVGNAGATDSSDVVQVQIDWPEACPRYACRVIRNAKVARSPMWLASKLVSVGARPINNVVDVTNYVMYEWGHPLHAFDLSKMAGSCIRVRRAEEGEELELLDGTTVTLSPGNLVIADASSPLALAGVMGGAASQTKEHTRDILLEAAYFDPVVVRKSSHGLAIRTESSHRFERGMDPNHTLECALDAATQLICELAGGHCDGDVVDIYPHPIRPKEFELSLSKINSFLGADIGQPEVTEFLENLGMECAEGLRVRVPTRRADVTDPVVLIEDIARLYGYDRIQARPTATVPLMGGRCDLDQFRSALADGLTAQGFLEACPFSLDDEARLTHFVDAEGSEPVRLRNPLTREMNALRSSLIPSLIQIANYNRRRGSRSLRFYEIGRCFQKSGREVNDHWVLTGIATGAVHELDWQRKPEPVDFFWLKGVVENLLDSVHIELGAATKADAPYLHPHQGATLLSNGRTLGCLGKLHPTVAEAADTGQDTFVFCLDVATLFQCSDSVPQFTSHSQMPSIGRDLAFVINADTHYGLMEKTIRELGGPLLESVSCFDRYEGTALTLGKISLGVSLGFRANDRTLTAEEVDATCRDIVAALEREYDATLRH